MGQVRYKQVVDALASDIRAGQLRPGTRLEVTGHCRPGCIGQLREVTWVNTQGVYTKILNPPDPRINAANDGRGSIMW